MVDAALLTLGFISLLTNSFLLGFIWSKANLRTLSTAILQSMLINGILWSIYSIARFAGQFNSYSVYLCVLLPRFGQGIFVNLNLHACFIMLERYISVAFPFRYEQLVTKKKIIIIIIASVWMLSLVIPITAIISLNREGGATNCTLIQVKSFVTVDASIHTCLLVVASLLLVILFLIYNRVICLIRMQEIRIVKSSTLEEATQDSTVRIIRKQKAVIQAVVVFTFYFTLLMPFLFASTLAFYDLTSRSRLKAASVTRYLAFSYPAIQPFIYAYYTANIRKALVSAISKRKVEFNAINTIRSPNISTH